MRDQYSQDPLPFLPPPSPPRDISSGSCRRPVVPARARLPPPRGGAGGLRPRPHNDRGVRQAGDQHFPPRHLRIFPKYVLDADFLVTFASTGTPFQDAAVRLLRAEIEPILIIPWYFLLQARGMGPFPVWVEGDGPPSPCPPPTSGTEPLCVGSVARHCLAPPPGR